jgi:ADP-ribosyl-[dinitrogen reductase] hydrolase
MQPGRLPAGTFTDDTEMALALAESLLAHTPLDPEDLAQRFVAWYQAGPDDVGIHTGRILSRIAGGIPWEEATASVQAEAPNSAGNGSVMRCWPIALAAWDQPGRLVKESTLQSRVTHPHAECIAGSVFVNVAIAYLLQGDTPAAAVAQAGTTAALPAPLQAVIQAAPHKERGNLENSGWVRHTLESAVWGLLTTESFEEAVVQVVNLGRDADTAGAVIGALAGATYGLSGIPKAWQDVVHGTWPLHSGTLWQVPELITLADELTKRP